MGSEMCIRDRSKLVLSSWKALADKQGYDTDAVGNSIEAISSFHNAAKSSGILTEKVDVLNALKTLSTVWEYLAKTLANIEVPSDRIKTKFVRIANYANSSAKEIYAVAEQAFQDRQGKTSDQSQACLLYTSPSPRDLSTSRMPSSA